MHLLNMATRNIWRNTRRSILSAIAIAISVAAIVFLFGLLRGLEDDVSLNVQNFISGELRVRHVDFDTYEHLSPLHLAIPNADEMRATIQNHPAVRNAVVRIPFNGLYFQDDDTFGIEVLAGDFAEEERYLNISNLLLDGRLPQDNTNEAVVGSELLKRFGLSVGDQMTLLVTTFARSSNAFTVRIVGVIDFPYASLSRNAVMLPLARAQRYLRAGSAATEILIKLTDRYDTEQAQDELTRLLSGENISVKHWSEVSSAAGILRSSRISYLIMGLVFLLLSSTVIVNTTMMVIYERVQEIGMLGAIGMSLRQIVRLFYIEALCIGGLGALVGLLIGAGMNGYFGYAGLDLTAQLGGADLGISNIVYPRNTFASMAGVFCYAMIISGITTLLPTRRCAKIRPVDALRHD